MNILGIKGRAYTMYGRSKHIKAHLKHTCTPLVLSAFLGLAACSGGDNLFDRDRYDLLDRKQGLSRDDYKDMLRVKPDTDKEIRPYFEGDAEPTAALKSAPIPEITEILAAPRPPAIGEAQLVSIFVTDDVPLKDVLIELGRLADIDMEIDSSIQGGIVFRAQNRPFNEVIERISRMADLRYEMKNGVLRIERDTAVVRTYALDFLSFDRSSSSDINISTSVLQSGSSVGGGGGTGGGGGGGGSGGAGGGGEGLNSGSSASVSYQASSDFWQQLTAGLNAIAAYVPASRSLAAVQDADVAPGAGASAAGGSAAQAGPARVTVNRQAGTVTVHGSERVHDMVEDYLRQVRESASSQVLIEAKIIEITLDDRYQTGINWNEVFSSKFLTLDVDFNNVETTGGNLTQLVLGGTGVNDPSLDAIVQLTEAFGTTRTLSSPRIHAMNNQQAVLTFAENLVYFDITIEREQQTAGDTVLPPLLTVDAQPVTVPIGIIISLQPAINTRTNEVTLSIRPTLSRLVQFIPDPSVAFLLAQVDSDVTVNNLIPQIEVRELDSLMRMRSGQVMVLGGLMEQIGENNDEGVPFLSGIPWIGNAFKAVNKREQVRELFILVKATIIGNTSSVDPVDKQLYRKFTTDHRPLAF